MYICISIIIKLYFPNNINSEDDDFKKKLEIGIIQLRCTESWVQRQFM